MTQFNVKVQLSFHSFIRYSLGFWGKMTSFKEFAEIKFSPTINPNILPYLLLIHTVLDETDPILEVESLNMKNRDLLIKLNSTKSP